MTVLLSFYVLLLGLALGSFIALAALRLAEGESVVSPRSHCRSCQRQLAWYENIPLLSYVLLRGRCRSCHSPISLFYPLVEAITTVVVFLAYLKLQPLPRFLLYLLPCIVPVLILGFMDARSLLLPDVLTLPGILLGFVVHGVDGVYFFAAHRSPVWIFPLESALGALAGAGTLYLLAWSYEKIRGRQGMGGGDIKYAAMLGAFFGWKAVFFIFLLAAVLGIIAGLLLILVGKNTRSSYLPFGTFLSAAALLYLLWGDVLLRIYLRSIYQLSIII